MTVSLSETQPVNSPENKEVVLSVEGVSKKFCRSLKRSLLYGIQDIATDLAGLRKEDRDLRTKEFWALNDVSFELRKGEALGLVGKNGSGKSTLLRIIAGLIKPDKGKVRVKGRVAPLIALGAGFNPILTGRENIYANMSILGLSKKEIDERFDDVVEFAEIGDAIDAPVQTYSSGMAARLGFATAIHTEPDILLIDEVLAVGDIKFKSKCHRKLAKLQSRGVSFILVSHQVSSILNTCSSAIYLSQGAVIEVASSISIIKHYEKDLFRNSTTKVTNSMLVPENLQNNSRETKIIHLFFRNGQGAQIECLETGKETIFCVQCKNYKEINNANLFIVIRQIGVNNDILLHLSSFYDNTSLKLKIGINEIQLKMPYLGLKPGLYSMKIFLKKESIHILDAVESFLFLVEEEKNSITCGLFYQPRTWQNIDTEKTILN